MFANNDRTPHGPAGESQPKARARPGESAAAPPGVLRADHVQLTGLIPGLPFLASGVKRSGWLVLTDRGEFRFYDKRLPDMAKEPAQSAAAAEQFVQKIGMFGVLVRFGKVKYYMWFTGEPSPDRHSANIEEKAGKTGDIVGYAGTVAGGSGASQGQSISTSGNLVSLAVDILQMFRMARNRKRRAAARAAWYPVLAGTRPWSMINAAKATEAAALETGSADRAG
jgi:hypothetical protein